MTPWLRQDEGWMIAFVSPVGTMTSAADIETTASDIALRASGSARHSGRRNRTNSTSPRLRGHRERCWEPRRRVWPNIDLLEDTGTWRVRSPNTVEMPRYSILSFSGVPVPWALM